MNDLFTDRAIEWFERCAAIARLAMLGFIAYALWNRFGWVDASATVFALFLVVRALRPREGVAGDVHVHNHHTSNVAHIDAGARARALADSINRKGQQS